MLCLADILLFYTKKMVQYREYCTIFVCFILSVLRLFARKDKHG